MQIERNFQHNVILNLIRVITAFSLIAAIITLFDNNLEARVRFFIFLVPFINLILLFIIHSTLYRFQASIFFSGLTLVLVFDAQIHWFLYLCYLGFFMHIFNFIVFIVYDIWHIRHHSGINIRLLHENWHVALLRIALGLLLIPNFPGKLFESSQAFQSELDWFISAGFPNFPEIIVLVGLFELAGALSFILGFGIRFFSISTFFVLMTAFILNGSLSDLFMVKDASETSTWLFALFWPFLVLTFAFFKSDILSLDYYLKTHYKIPKFIRFFM